MKSKEIHSLTELHDHLKSSGKTFLLLYKESSTSSERAFHEFVSATENVSDLNVIHANLARVRDIHPAYSITSAPTLLEFENETLKNIHKGAQPASFYKALFEDALYIVQAEKSGKPVKRVTVYSTPTCSWCNTLKSYLRKHRVRFTDIDVSRDPSVAQELVRRTGQQGVPQTEINGQIIVGFDKAKINQLLEIHEHV